MRVRVCVRGGGAQLASELSSIFRQYWNNVVKVISPRSSPTVYKSVFHSNFLHVEGWEDVSLASEGFKEAVAAGKLLKEHGFTFDVVYTRFVI